MCAMTIYVDEELARQKAQWIELMEVAPDLPTFTWEDLREAILEESTSPSEELVLRGALSALAKMARFKPADQLIREIVVLAASACDPSFAFRTKDMGSEAMA